MCLGDNELRQDKTRLGNSAKDRPAICRLRLLAVRQPPDRRPDEIQGLGRVRLGRLMKRRPHAGASSVAVLSSTGALRICSLFRSISGGSDGATLGRIPPSLKAALEEKAARILDDVGMKTMHFRHGLSGVAAR